MVFINTAYTIMPSLLAITLAIFTKRILLSLLAGIILGGLLVQGFNIVNSFYYLAVLVISLFWNKGINFEHINLLLYFFVLGTIIQLLKATGSIAAFGAWSGKFIRSRRSGNLFISALGALIFIDDYFNSLAVGSIGQPIADYHGTSRAKLAYLIDSTAAPVCIINPISSWGAYIIGILSSILMMYQIENITAISMFVQLLPMQYYALIAIALVFVVSSSNLNFGSMAIEENRSIKKMNQQDKQFQVNTFSNKAVDMIVVMSVLLITTTIAFIWTGSQALSRFGLPFSFVGTFKYTNPAYSLLLGGLVSLFVILLFSIFRKLTLIQTRKCFISGTKSMLPAVWILLMAWILVRVINDLEVGNYLSSLIVNKMSVAYLPLLIFFIAAFVSFSIGSSWGTFGVMLPIAAQIAITLNPDYLTILFAAVLSGALAGDHCSPISDTTILSSIGAKCNHMDHVLTQLPYCLFAFFIAALGYLVLGITKDITISLMATLSLFFMMLLILFKLNKRSQQVSVIGLAG